MQLDSQTETKQICGNKTQKQIKLNQHTKELIMKKKTFTKYINLNKTIRKEVK